MNAFWMIDQLVAQGVRHFCIAPGSRSSPLVLAAAEHPLAQTHVHYDERGLCFFALGLGNAHQKPAAIITTSGTAVGNLLPAVMEAHHSHIPLLLLTADRPPELRSCDANQTTDQVKIFQSFVRWQFDFPCSDASEAFIRSQTAEAVFHAQTGPVQLNCMFRDPLHEIQPILRGRPIELLHPKSSCEPRAYLAEKKQGIILIGRTHQNLAPVFALAKKLQWPIFADLLSNARCTQSDHLIQFYDFLLKQDLHPDCILHFGGKFTSKRILEWLKKSAPETYIHVHEYSDLSDSSHQQTMRIAATPEAFCQSLVCETANDLSWLNSWKERDAAARRAIETLFAETSDTTESTFLYRLAQTALPNTSYFFGNGMPIREAEWFFFPSSPKRFYGNRGLSGIDGNIATIAGLATDPLVAVIGDQTALHDLNSLPLLLEAKAPVMLCISNNFGGGIFSHLPIAKNNPHFEKFWTAPHTWQLQEAAHMFRIPTFDSAHLEDAIAKQQTCIIEFFTSREQNLRFHNHLREQIDCLLQKV